MRTFLISPLVSGNVCTHIGRICVYWSNLELVVERLIWHLDGKTPKEGRPITAKENIDPRLKRLKKLSKQVMTPEDALKITAISSDIKAVKRARNWAVHGLYGRSLRSAFKR